MDLTAFLTARLDEDEYAAKAAELRFPGPWEQADDPGSSLPSAVTMFDSRDESIGVIRGGYVAAHIARHDPDRVLREVAAKRAIVSEARDMLDVAFSGEAGEGFAVVALRQMASVYSDHSDYRTEWKP